MALSARRVRQLYAWHKWAGLLTGLFIFVITISGAIAVFKEEIDLLLTPARRVEPASTPPASLDDILPAVQRAYTGARIESVNLPRNPHTAYSIFLDDGKQRTEVFVNPYSGALTGARTGETVANVIRQLHVRFYYFGAWGRVVVGVFGLALLVSTLTGVLIYGRFMKGVFAQGLRFWQIRTGRGLQVSASDWHKLIGILALAFNLVIAFTGAVLGLENLARYAPSVSRALHPQPDQRHPPAATDRMVPLAQALRRARRALPGFEPTRLILPRADKNHFVIYGDNSGRFAREGASFVVIETSGGAVLQTHNSAGARAVTYTYNLVEPLHFGNFAGVPLKLIYLSFGLASSFLSVTGFIIWLRKRRRARVAAPSRRREKTSELQRA